MKLACAILFLSSSLFAEMDYHKLITQFPDILGRDGSWKSGEIEVATSPNEIQRIEKLAMQRYIRMGYSKDEAKDYTRAGIVAEDHYWIWIRDAVTFPGGIPGVYNRILWKSGLTGAHGVAIMPVVNNKILININFRHATRSWEMELPRGARKDTETNEEAALRELKEETGCISKELRLLGETCPDSGVLVGAVPVYLAKVDHIRARHQDESEAIAVNVEMTLDEIKTAFEKGYIITEIRGEKTKVYCRDPFLSYAILQAMWKKAI